MTPEAKAKELYEKYSEILYPTIVTYPHIIRHNCIIAVDFYLKNNTSNACTYYGMSHSEYWGKVKEHINNF